MDVTNHFQAWVWNGLLLKWWRWWGFVIVLLHLCSHWGVVAEQSKVVGVVDEHWLINSPLIGSLGAVERALVLYVKELHVVTRLNLDSVAVFINVIQVLVHSVVVLVSESPMLHKLNVLASTQTR